MRSRVSLEREDLHIWGKLKQYNEKYFYKRSKQIFVNIVFVHASIFYAKISITLPCLKLTFCSISFKVSKITSSLAFIKKVEMYKRTCPKSPTIPSTHPLCPPLEQIIQYEKAIIKVNKNKLSEQNILRACKFCGHLPETFKDSLYVPYLFMYF